MRQFNNSTIQQLSQKGFTLIELMVSIGVFAIVVGIMSSMLMTSLRGQKKSTTAQNMADNIRFAMEIMSKEIRMGTGFSADTIQGCTVTCRLRFTSTMPKRYGKPAVFYFNDTNKRIMFDDDTGTNPPDPAPITSSLNINVTSLEFIISGSSGNAPRVTVVVRAKSAGTTNDVSTSYDIQTTLSPRKL